MKEMQQCYHFVTDYRGKEHDDNTLSEISRDDKQGKSYIGELFTFFTSGRIYAYAQITEIDCHSIT